MANGYERRVSKTPHVHFSGCHEIDGQHLFGPVDFTLGAGEWTCLLGASGVGKSTILRLIAGLDTGGVFSGDISTNDGEDLAGRVSYMAQSDLLLPWLDILGNVTIGARLREEKPDVARANALIEQVGLAAHKHKKPLALSGGMRQRAALARALMEDRPIILLDEPFSALDARTRAEMQELAAKTLRGKTVLLVTHDPAEAARLGHKILLMSSDGLERCDVPDTPVVRDTYDAETIKCQVDLFTKLRGIPA